MKSLFKVLFFLFFSQISKANITMPSFFGSNMVIQQKSKVKFWGWGQPLEKVKFVASWDDTELETVVNNQGNWEITTKTPAYGGPFEISIHGKNEINFTNIMLGEVWMCSGQSNMAWTPKSGINNPEEAIKNANKPEIRFFNTNLASAEYPQQNLIGNWETCTPETMARFSAIGYFFAAHLNENLKIPIGIINSSWGGTPAEAWTPIQKINVNPALSKSAETLKEVPWGPTKTGLIYNAMIAPFKNFKIKGFLWYQGESNVPNAQHYDKLLTTMISAWREQWQEEIPFYYVQIAPFKYDEKDQGVLVRNAQRMAESTPNTGMVVISDIGDTQDIHPKNKQDVGIRLANLAMKNLYYGSPVPVSGPRLIGYEARRDQMVLYFDTEDLVCDAKCSNQFEIADASGEFKKANIKIRSNSIILHTNKVNYPIFGRFAWGNTEISNLKNKYGLPASSFVTDNWLQLKGY